MLNLTGTKKSVEKTVNDEHRHPDREGAEKARVLTEYPVLYRPVQNVTTESLAEKRTPLKPGPKEPIHGLPKIQNFMKVLKLSILVNFVSYFADVL